MLAAGGVATQGRLAAARSGGRARCLVEASRASAPLPCVPVPLPLPPKVDPSVGFDQVGGLDTYIDALKEMVFLPLVYPELFTRFSVTPPRGVLFYGPPGTGGSRGAQRLGLLLIGVQLVFRRVLGRGCVGRQRGHARGLGPNPCPRGWLVPTASGNGSKCVAGVDWLDDSTRRVRVFGSIRNDESLLARR